jgi:hypothetical protein
MHRYASLAAAPARRLLALASPGASACLQSERTLI